MKLIVLLLVACVGAAPAKRSLTKEETREVYKTVLGVLRRRHLENKRILDKKMVTDIPLTELETTTEEPTAFEKEVLSRLNWMDQGIQALHISPLFTQIVETLDNLENLCKHVMKIPHGDGHHKEDKISGGHHDNNNNGTSLPPPEKTHPPPAETTSQPPPAEEKTSNVDSMMTMERKRALLEQILSALSDPQNGDRKKRSGDRQKRNVWADVDWHLIGQVCHTFEETKWQADWAFDWWIENE